MVVALPGVALLCMVCLAWYSPAPPLPPSLPAVHPLQSIKQGEQAAKLGLGDPKAFKAQRATAEKNVQVRAWGAGPADCGGLRVLHLSAAERATCQMCDY
jgi:hypothetical protein